MNLSMFKHHKTASFSRFFSTKYFSTDPLPFFQDSEYGSPVKSEYSPTKPTPPTPIKSGPSGIGNVQSLDELSKETMIIMNASFRTLVAEISVSSFSFRTI